MKKLLPILVGVPFTVYSVLVILEQGYFGFLKLAWREPWGMQLLLDLGIALFVVGGWIRRDAKSNGIQPAPYLVALPVLGSVATFAYLAHRWVVRRKGARETFAHEPSASSVVRS